MCHRFRKVPLSRLLEAEKASHFCHTALLVKAIFVICLNFSWCYYRFCDKLPLTSFDDKLKEGSEECVTQLVESVEDVEKTGNQVADHENEGCQALTITSEPSTSLHQDSGISGRTEPFVEEESTSNIIANNRDVNDIEQGISEDNRQPTEDRLVIDGVFIEGEPDANNAGSPKRLNSLVGFLKALKAFMIDYHMPLLLLLALIVGILIPVPGKALGDVRLGDGLCLTSSNYTLNGQVCVWNTLSTLCVTIIFLISGLNLDIARFKRALRARKEILLGFFLIFGLTSSFGFAIAAAPKLDPPEFSFGMSLFPLMPTTMSSCVIIVGYAKGNVELALLLTITSNVLAVAILPVTVLWLVDVYQLDSVEGIPVRVDAVQLCLNLVFQVVCPLIFAVLVKLTFREPVTKFVKSHVYALKVISATLNAAIPWMRISQNAQNFSRTSGLSYFIIILCVVALHILFLSLTAITSLKLVRLRGEEESKTITFIGAQKTLPIALSVLELLPPAVTGDQGLVLVPMVFMYLFQAIFDSILAVKWSRRTLTC